MNKRGVGVFIQKGLIEALIQTDGGIHDYLSYIVSGNTAVAVILVIG